MIKNYKLFTEGIRDKMIPKSKEEINRIINDWTPRDRYLKGVTMDDKYLKSEGEKYMKKFDDVQIGDLLTIAVPKDGTQQPLVKIKEKYTFNNKEEFKNYLRKHPGIIIDSNALKMLFKSFPNQKRDAVVVSMVYDMMFEYGRDCGVFPYTEQEIRDNMSKRPYESDEIQSRFHDEYLSEGVKDMMTPKSEDDIKKSLEAAPPQKKLKIGANQNLNWLIKLAIEEGIDMTSVENNSQIIPLCKNGNTEMVKLLVDNGADINISNGVCLQRAVDSKNAELVKLLIDLGADVHVNIDYAIRWASYHNITKMVKYLLESGAKANVASNFPMKMAIKNNNNEIIELLNKYIK